MEIIAIPAFQDNYIWLLHDGRQALVVDPGDAAPVLEALSRLQLRLAGVLITHHHNDHVGGLPDLLAAHPAPAWGPASPAISGLSNPVRDGTRIEVPGMDLNLEVLETPGHTASHLAYRGPDFVFCGDTLFSAGCGRVFDGTPAQLFASLQRLAALPADTRVYCTHEYTLANLAFAVAAEPDNPARDVWLAKARALRERALPTLPTTIGHELSINPFLRSHEASVQAGLLRHGGAPADALGNFVALRAWKNDFRG